MACTHVSTHVKCLGYYSVPASFQINFNEDVYCSSNTHNEIKGGIVAGFYDITSIETQEEGSHRREGIHD